MNFAPTKTLIAVVGVVVAAVLTAVGITGGVEAVLTTVGVAGFVGGLAACAVAINRLTNRAEQAQYNATAPGGVPIAPIQPEDKPVNHLLHLVLTVITGGVWLLPWLLICLSVSEENKRTRRNYRAALRQYSADLAAYNGR